MRLTISSLTCRVMAKEMARQHQGFAGGIYLYNDPAPDQAYNISNMILDPDGRPYKRQGFNFKTAIPPVGAGILSLFRWERPGAAPQLLAHGNDGKLYYSNDLLTFTESGAGVVLSTTEPASFEPFVGGAGPIPYVYVADGTNALRRWDGSTFALAGGTPATAARYLKVWKDTMFALTVSGRLYYSAAGNGESWPALNWADLGVGDGDIGTALFTASQELIVCKRNRTWVVASPITLENRVVDYEKGCESHFSVVKFDAEIYYITRLGVVRFLSGVPAELQSNNIQPVFTPLWVDLSKLNRAWGYRVHHRVGWALTRAGQANPDFLIEMYPHYPRRPWTFHRMPAKTLVTWRDASERLFFSDGSRGLFEAFATGQITDDGVAGWSPYFSGILQLPWEDFGDPLNRKYLRAIRLFGEGDIFMQVLKDRRSQLGQLLEASMIPVDPKWNESPTDKWGAGDVWGTFGSIGTDIVYPDIYGRQFSVLIYDLPKAGDKPIPAQRRYISDVLVQYSHGWSLLEMTLEAVQMGELG